MANVNGDESAATVTPNDAETADVTAAVETQNDLSASGSQTDVTSPPDADKLSLDSASADSATVSENSEKQSNSSKSETNSRRSSTASSKKESLAASGATSHVAKATSSAPAKPASTGKAAPPASAPAAKSKLKSAFNLFRRKSSGGKKSDERTPQDLDAKLAAVTIDSLPQVFSAKYLGYKTTRGLYGIQYTREPLQKLVQEIQESDSKDKLPLTQLHVSIRGIHVAEHKSNTEKSMTIDAGLIPIEFVSYGVQDVHYTRIFTFIVVREMSSRSRKLECHAYLCESSVTCRKLALSVALAFQQYAKTLEGKPHKFQVDLRPSAEISHDLVTSQQQQQQDASDETPTGGDCEA